MANNRIQVLHLLSALKTGGINSLLLQNVEHMSAGLLEHHVCAVGRIERDWACKYHTLGVEPFSLGHTGRSSSLRTLWRLVSVLSNRSIDVVHAHFPLEGAYSAMATSALGVPLVFSVHGNRSSSRAKRIKDVVLDRISFLSSTRIVAVSDSVAQSCVRWRGASRGKIEVIHNGVDTSRFSAAFDPEKTQETKARLQIPASAPVILSVGRLSSVKSQVTLVPMMEHLLSEVPSAVLLIVGEGPTKPRLESLVRQAGLRDHVRLLGLRLDVPTLMNLADVFVLPSVSEGFSITLLEAMASGLPAVASDIAPNREALSNGAVGKLVPVGDAHRFAIEVVSVLQSDKLAKKMSENSRNRAKSKFDIQRTAKQTEDLYLRVSTKP